MKISVLFFGILTDIVGENNFDLSLESNLDIKSFKVLLLDKYPNLINYSNFSIAVNETYVSEKYVLQNKDIVALIPPVSGG